MKTVFVVFVQGDFCSVDSDQSNTWNLSLLFTIIFITLLLISNDTLAYMRYLKFAEYFAKYLI